MKIRKVNRLILDSTEKQILRNAVTLIGEIDQAMNDEEIDDDFHVSLEDLEYGIEEIINKEYLGY